MDLIFFGMQGSGKGTLGKSLAERYGMEIFETGAELRKLSQQDTELARKVKSIIEAGHLVPNEVVIEIVENFLNNLKSEKSVLFDGIPRKTEQANSLNSLLEKNGRAYRAVLLEIKKETALKRLTSRRICSSCKAIYPADYTKDNCEKCGNPLTTRADDVPEAIATRLKAFEEETVPAMNLYSNIVAINGEPNIEEVKDLAFKALDPLMQP